ncbi:hypothetical protein [Thermococcus sp. JdF3]|uniref:hypothetical protein n=1 Tax=Thermococcus sp. JdF3 TaxID=1638258 RepID=UPI00143880E2|nr:hypothetical protein [Thermococcus sp. JdF3]NJE00516.1 hypothetical protein [Thermococcus sp. JdF3]
MREAQLSLDLLFAVTLMTLTVVSLISLATHEVEGARNLDTSTKVKVFAIDLRDTIVKVYAAGDGFAVKKTPPFELKSGEYLEITLNETSNELKVEAEINGGKYTTVQRIPVPLISNSTVTLTPSNNELWIVCQYNETAGGMDVRVSEKP